MKIKFWANQRGFSLIEAALSTVILAMGLMVGIMVTHQTTVANANTDFHIIATQLANEKMESIIADSYLQASQYDYIIGTNYPDEDIDYGSHTDVFERTVSITEVADDLTTAQSNSGYKKVDVNVTWGVEAYEQVSISTLLTNY